MKPKVPWTSGGEIKLPLAYVSLEVRKLSEYFSQLEMFYFLTIFKTEVWLIHNAVLVSSV